MSVIVPLELIICENFWISCLWPFLLSSLSFLVYINEHAIYIYIYIYIYLCVCVCACVGINTTSTETDVNRAIKKGVGYNWKIIWRSDFSEKIERNLFQIMVRYVLRYGCTTSTLTKCMNIKLCRNYTRIMRLFSLQMIKAILQLLNCYCSSL